MKRNFNNGSDYFKIDGYPARLVRDREGAPVTVEIFNGVSRVPCLDALRRIVEDNGDDGVTQLADDDAYRSEVVLTEQRLKRTPLAANCG